MNNPQQQFLPISLPMVYPQREHSAPGVSYPPARVQVAMEYLLQLTFKTMPRAAVNDMSIDWQDGQKLIGSEIESQMAACDLLTEYFRGNLKQDDWELQAVMNEKHRAAGVPDGPGLAMQCLACPAGRYNPSCVMCRGSGKVIVYPMSQEG